ncbi:MAG TPA: phosphotransferase family protein, partial [Pseudorhodoplanes sp.]|nr:phosphotransferase family protein [Pseudorhodoplanes sp.]
QQTSLEQDWDVLEALKATGFEAPDAVWIGSIGDIPAMVVRRIIAPAPSIKFLEEGPFATGTAQLRGRMIENFVRTAADLHQISLARLGLTRLSQRGGPEGHFIDREINWVLAEFHSRFPAEEDGDRAPLHGEIRSNIDRVADLLRRHAPRHRTPVLVHGDYTLANVMFRDDGSIAALLDWELAHEGLPEEDIANAVVSAQSRAALGNPLSEFPSLAELAPMYQRFHPLPDTDWDFAALFASFRSTTWGAIGTRRFPPEFWPKQKLVWDAQKSILNRLANDFLKKKGIQSEQF